MLYSIALILFCGFALGGIMQKLKLPPLLGMMTTGIVLGPYVLNQISPSILDISLELRQMALIVILIRAGLALDVKELKKVGRPAILMCFVPASFELVAITLFAPPLLGVTLLEAAILGTVLAAVSPAVVVPRMLKLMEEGYGREKNIPQIILAGASVDDIYVIVLFTSFLGMYQGNGFQIKSLLQVPVSIFLGVVLGYITGVLMVRLFRIFHLRDTIKILLLLGVSFWFVVFESAIKSYVPISGLLAVMALGAAFLRKNKKLAVRLSSKYSKIWVGAELFLFVLVGAAVDITYLGKAGLSAVVLIFGALLLRVVGVFISLLKTNLLLKEKLFCAISYLPKATVQAAIGSIPLAAGVQSGNIILAVAVLSILITAPLGAVGIDKLYKKTLQKNSANHSSNVVGG